MLKLEVCLTPALLPLYDIDDRIVVVIDVLRATSSMCYAFHNGAASIVPVASVEECRSYAGKDYLLCAERDGKVVEGFDAGNSPFSFEKDRVEGKNIVLTTTNGTKAIQLSRSSKQVLIGSFLNLDSLCSYLKAANSHVLLLCAGWKDKFNLEDTLFAGSVVQQLKGQFELACDAAVAAEDIYEFAKNDLRGYLHKSSHSHRLAELNIEEDVLFCLKMNQTDVIPVLEGDKLVKL